MKNKKIVVCIALLAIMLSSAFSIAAVSAASDYYCNDGQDWGQTGDGYVDNVHNIEGDTNDGNYACMIVGNSGDAVRVACFFNEYWVRNPTLRVFTSGTVEVSIDITNDGMQWINIGSEDFNSSTPVDIPIDSVWAFHCMTITVSYVDGPASLSIDSVFVEPY
jgi:hypothetical protein